MIPVRRSGKGLGLFIYLYIQTYWKSPTKLHALHVQQGNEDTTERERFVIFKKYFKQSCHILFVAHVLFWSCSPFVYVVSFTSCHLSCFTHLCVLLVITPYRFWFSVFVWVSVLVQCFVLWFVQCVFASVACIFIFEFLVLCFGQ